jgi:hypothetical protein
MIDNASEAVDHHVALAVLLATIVADGEQDRINIGKAGERVPLTDICHVRRPTSCLKLHGTLN